MKVVHLYVINQNVRKASTALYTDVRSVRHLVECLRAVAPKGTDVVLAEMLSGFRIEVYM